MSQRVYKLLDNSGTYYIAFETIIDQFVSPAFHSSMALMLTTQGVGQEVVARGENNPLTFTDEVLLSAARSIEKLKDGLLVTSDEAVVLGNFFDFLSASVAWHQYSYVAIDDSVVQSWIQELGLDKEFPGDDPQEIVDDKALCPAFQRIANDKNGSTPPSDSGEVIPSPAQNKLAGRFMAAVATIAGVYPFGSLTPHEVVDKFYQLSQVWKYGDYIAYIAPSSA